MPWTLRIRVVDVGQGDCTIVLAEDTTGAQTRTMLIDGGLDRHARTAHEAMGKEIPGLPLDHMLVTSYSREHYEGLMSLLHADNLYHLADMIAEATVVGADP